MSHCRFSDITKFSVKKPPTWGQDFEKKNQQTMYTRPETTKYLAIALITLTPKEIHRTPRLREAASRAISLDLFPPQVSTNLFLNSNGQFWNSR